MRDLISLSQPTISSHLKLLENAGLITYKKDGRWVDYRLNTELNSDMRKLLNCIILILGGIKEIKEDQKRVQKIDRNFICKK